MFTNVSNILYCFAKFAFNALKAGLVVRSNLLRTTKQNFESAKQRKRELAVHLQVAHDLIKTLCQIVCDLQMNYVRITKDSINDRQSQPGLSGDCYYLRYQGETLGTPGSLYMHANVYFLV